MTECRFYYFTSLLFTMSCVLHAISIYGVLGLLTFWLKLAVLAHTLLCELVALSYCFLLASILVYKG